MKKTLFSLFAILLTSLAMGQTKPVKIAYCDVDYILSQHPQFKAANKELATLENKYQQQAVAIEQQIMQLQQEVQQGGGMMTEQAKMQKQQRYEQLLKQYQQLEITASQAIQTRQMELMKPILDDIEKKIKAVADEKGYTHVLNERANGTSIVLYADESNNITDEVLRKLGIMPK